MYVLYISYICVVAIIPSHFGITAHLTHQLAKLLIRKGDYRSKIFSIAVSASAIAPCNSLDLIFFKFVRSLWIASILGKYSKFSRIINRSELSNVFTSLMKPSVLLSAILGITECRYSEYSTASFK